MRQVCLILQHLLSEWPIMWTTMLEAWMVSAHSTSRLLLLGRLMGHRLSTLVHSSTIVHDVDISQKLPRQGRSIAPIEHHVEVSTLILLLHSNPPQDAPPRRGSCCVLEKAQLWATFYRSDDIVVSATMSSGIPVNTSSPPTGYSSFTKAISFFNCCMQLIVK